MLANIIIRVATWLYMCTRLCMLIAHVIDDLYPPTIVAKEILFGLENLLAFVVMPSRAPPICFILTLQHCCFDIVIVFMNATLQF